jgi:endonuclease-3
VKKSAAKPAGKAQAGATRKTASKSAVRVANIPGISPDAQPLAPARRPGEELRSRANAIFDILSEAHADAHCALEYRDPFQLLVMTILSAQCTDDVVNKVSPGLFARYPDAEAMASADLDDVMKIIRSTGFFRAKANNIVAAGRALVERHGGRVPEGMAELVALPGVGRKTANIVRGNAFHLPGMGVDTHVRRLSQRMALTRSDDPVEIEGDLCALWPPDRWTMGTHFLIFHGRRVCHARAPRCSGCVVQDLCPSAFLKAPGRAIKAPALAARVSRARTKPRVSSPRRKPR